MGDAQALGCRDHWGVRRYHTLGEEEGSLSGAAVPIVIFRTEERR